MFTTGSTEGPDRVAKVLNLFYGGDGFYFNEIGQYKIRASYMNGEHYVVSDEVEITVEDIGDESLVTEFKVGVNIWSIMRNFFNLLWIVNIN